MLVCDHVHIVSMPSTRRARAPLSADALSAIILHLCGRRRRRPAEADEDADDAPPALPPHRFPSLRRVDLVGARVAPNVVLTEEALGSLRECAVLTSLTIGDGMALPMRELRGDREAAVVVLDGQSYGRHRCRRLCMHGVGGLDCGGGGGCSSQCFALLRRLSLLDASIVGGLMQRNPFSSVLPHTHACMRTCTHTRTHTHTHAHAHAHRRARARAHTQVLHTQSMSLPLQELRNRSPSRAARAPVPAPPDDAAAGAAAPLHARAGAVGEALLPELHAAELSAGEAFVIGMLLQVARAAASEAIAGRGRQRGMCSAPGRLVVLHVAWMRGSVAAGGLQQ
jgi:hypothetical protein